MYLNTFVCEMYSNETVAIMSVNHILWTNCCKFSPQKTVYGDVKLASHFLLIIYMNLHHM